MSVTPLDVLLVGACPLTGTFNKAEAEAAAAWLIITMRKRGNRFGPVAPFDVGDTIRELVVSGEAPSWVTNPFLQPDFHRLISDGFARFVDGETSSMEFTDEGLKRLERWAQGEGAA